jgi:hypothetical protein
MLFSHYSEYTIYTLYMQWGAALLGPAVADVIELTQSLTPKRQ